MPGSGLSYFLMNREKNSPFVLPSIRFIPAFLKIGSDSHLPVKILSQIDIPFGGLSGMVDKAPSLTKSALC